MAKKAKKLKIKVIGCGGIGSWLVDPLCTMISYSSASAVEVGLIDGDHYEERNRERQNFVEIGPKATITAMRLQEKFPRLTIQDHPIYLTKANIALLIKDGDIVCGCVDNHRTRKLINDRAEELNNIVHLSGGNELTDGNVLIHIKKNGKDITLPVANKYHPELQNPTDKNPGDEDLSRKKGCDVMVVSEPQLVATNFQVASIMLSELYKIIINHDRVGKSNEIHFDILTSKMNSMLREK